MYYCFLYNLSIDSIAFACHVKVVWEVAGIVAFPNSHFQWRGPSLTTRHVDGTEIEANENVIAVVRKEMKVNGMPRAFFAYLQGWAKKWSPGCENVSSKLR